MYCYFAFADDVDHIGGAGDDFTKMDRVSQGLWIELTGKHVRDFLCAPSVALRILLLSRLRLSVFSSGFHGVLCL
jgi:hypothetical protein